MIKLHKNIRIKEKKKKEGEFKNEKEKRAKKKKNASAKWQILGAKFIEKGSNLAFFGLTLAS